MEKNSGAPPEANTDGAPKTLSPQPLRQPSPEAIEILAKMVVSKGIREGKLKVLPEKA